MCLSIDVWMLQGAHLGAAQVFTPVIAMAIPELCGTDNRCAFGDNMVVSGRH